MIHRGEEGEHEDSDLNDKGEPMTEIDRFIDAMISIREEIREIEEGRMDPDDNPLKNAPHSSRDMVGEWNHPYSREAASFPDKYSWQSKFWPHVSRVDNVYGDRNLFCACPPMESWSGEEQD